MDVAAYLKRIRYSGSTDPSPETLGRIHRAHMLAVPFENLDIPLKRPIVCEEASFLRKIVEQHRGGFCYEMNGAFAALLRALGFRVTLLSARVPRADGSDGPEFDHLTLRVDLDEPWLADVGFGDSFIEPLRLRTAIEQEQFGRRYRIMEAEGSLHLQCDEGGAQWRPEYSFSLTPRQLSDFAKMCHYHQTSPESPFTRKKVCSIATENGRVTLSDTRLIVTRNGQKKESVVTSEDERRDLLRDQFGVVL
jgi:N-hydroxyarylamine O-acetyltransferase